MLTPRSRRRSSDARVPQGLITASEWSWRVLVIAAVLALLWLGLTYFSSVSVPLSVAILLTALLTPINNLLRSWKWPPVLAAVGCLLAMALLVLGVFGAIGANVVQEWPQLWQSAEAGFATLVNWLATGPLQLDQAQLTAYYQQFIEWVNSSQADLAAALAQAGIGVGHFFAGLAIALIATFFFLASGPSMWASMLRLMPTRYLEPTRRASERGWLSLVSYMRAQVLVALVDALGIMVGAMLLGLPMASALFALTFVVAFVPVIGAVLSGTVACAIALVTYGPLSALLMLLITIVVMETEGHFLQPVLLGRAVSLHPLAVLLGLAVGATIAGIVGALLVIPVLSFTVSFIRGLDPDRFDSPSPDLPK